MKNISAALAFALALFGLNSGAQAQTTQVGTEYLMTVHIPTERVAVDSSLTIVNILPGGTVKGPKITGKILPPGGDWVRVMPSGALRLDVKLTIETDDGALIYMTYGGVVVGSKETSEALARGEVLGENGFPYFVTTPQFQTASPKYDWLNKLQGIGKVASYRRSKEESYVRYDVYAVR
jgi:hypothetical protein